MEKDPVCGMEVDPKDAPGVSEYNGKKYYFCSIACKLTFDKDPERYIDLVEASKGHKH